MYLRGTEYFLRKRDKSMKKNNVKIIVCVVVMVACFIGMVFSFVMAVKSYNEQNKPNGEQYTMTAVVVEIDRDADVVTCEDGAGFLWEFYEVDDWRVGDTVALLMNNNGTETIFDDVIVHAYYGG